MRRKESRASLVPGNSDLDLSILVSSRLVLSWSEFLRRKDRKKKARKIERLKERIRDLCGWVLKGVLHIFYCIAVIKPFCLDQVRTSVMDISFSYSIAQHSTVTVRVLPDKWGKGNWCI